MQVRKFLAAIILAAITLTSGPLNAQEAIVGVDAVVLQPLSQTQPVIGRFVAKQAGIVSARVAGAVITTRPPRRLALREATCGR